MKVQSSIGTFVLNTQIRVNGYNVKHRLWYIFYLYIVFNVYNMEPVCNIM